MTRKKKLQDQGNFWDQSRLSGLRANNRRRGIQNTTIDQARPTLEVAQNETITRGPTNQLIILGEDKPGVPSSGYGGQGATQTSRIDLIAGLASSFPGGVPSSNTMLSPNFAIDASRIYISQQADPDHYMGLAGSNVKARSMIGLKSDTIRLHAREGLKIVTGKSRLDGRHDEKNSNGGDIDGVQPIEIIPGNYSHDEKYVCLNLLDVSKQAIAVRKKVQGVVRGEDLSQMLDELLEVLIQILQKVEDNTTNMSLLAKAFGSHFHDSAPGFGAPTTPSSIGIVGGAITKIQNFISIQQAANVRSQIDNIRENFMTPRGSTPFLSKHVKGI